VRSRRLPRHAARLHNRLGTADPGECGYTSGRARGPTEVHVPERVVALAEEVDA